MINLADDYIQQDGDINAINEGLGKSEYNRMQGKKFLFSILTKWGIVADDAADVEGHAGNDDEINPLLMLDPAPN